MGKSDGAMIAVRIAGETDPVKLARLADRWAKGSQEELREALRGRVTKQHRFLIRLHIDQIDALAAAIARIDAHVEESLGRFQTAVALIMSITGIKSLSAHVIVSEIGVNMNRSLRPHISSPGLVSARATKRVLASVDPIACARARSCSRPRCIAPGQRSKRKTDLQAQFFRIAARCSRSPPRCSPPSITCSRWNTVPRPRPQLLRSPVHRPAKKAPGQASGRSWLRCRTHPGRRLSHAYCQDCLW